MEEAAFNPAIELLGGDPQTGEHTYQGSSYTVTKVLAPITDFPTWGSIKGTENPQDSDFEARRCLITDLPQNKGSRDPWRGQTKPCVPQDPGETKVTPQEAEPSLSVSVWEFLAEACVNRALSRCQDHSQQQSWYAQPAGISPFGEGTHQPYHSVALGHTTRREQSPTHQQKIGLNMN